MWPIYENIMTASSVVRSRIDDGIKQEASVVLASMGLYRI